MLAFVGFDSEVVERAGAIARCFARDGPGDVGGIAFARGFDAEVAFAAVFERFVARGVASIALDGDLDSAFAVFATEDEAFGFEVNRRA